MSAGGLGVGLGGTGLGIYEGNQAASAQRHAANSATDQLNAGKQQALGYLNPYQQAGQSALNPLSGLLTGQQFDPATGQTSTLSADARQNLFQQSPGYKFNLDQMMKATQASQAAKGNLLSGGAQKEIAQYSGGLASNEYNNYLNQLFQLSGMGQNAAGSEANIATGVGSQLAQASYAGVMGNVNKANNLSNFGFGVGGMGFQNAMGGGSSSGSGGSGAASSGLNSAFGNTQLASPDLMAMALA